MKILIIDDHPLIIAINTDLIRNLFPQAEIETILDYTHHRSRIGNNYTLVISELSVLNKEPSEVVSELETSFPSSRKIFLTGLSINPVLGRHIEMRGHLVINKTATFQQVVGALNSFVGEMNTKMELSPSNVFRSSVQVPGKKPLTVKQVEVMDLASRGLTAKEVAKELNISPETARSHLKEAYVRLGASNKASAINQYLRSRKLSDVIYSEDDV